MADAMQVLIEKCKAQGAKAERERIAIRQGAAKECPPLYAKCCEFEQGRSCEDCWQDWLEADE